LQIAGKTGIKHFPNVYSRCDAAIVQLDGVSRFHLDRSFHNLSLVSTSFVSQTPQNNDAPKPCGSQSLSKRLFEVSRNALLSGLEFVMLNLNGMTNEANGNQAALETFARYRGLLFSVAYRMLGSVADAEDMLQETFIRWQRSADQEIESPRAFLVTIISRLCINHLQSARVQREEYVGEWLPEPLVTDMSSDPYETLKIDESISMAFLLLLERLNPIERAVFLLHEVFNYKFSEIAAIVDRTEANCRQILKRAREHVGDARQRFEATESDRDEMLRGFLQATQTGDMKGLLDLLANDVVLHTDGGGKAIALPAELHGQEKVTRAIIRSMEKLVPKNLELRTLRINGEAGFVSYLDGKPFSAITLQVADDHIQAIYIVSNPEKLSHLIKNR
jgi:RNA polymerase sigma-70 factor (ECF subfamily)